VSAFGWGTLAASSLVLGGVIALVLRVGPRTLGLIMAFGVGVLTSAVAYELVEEAFEASAWGVTWGLLAGAVTFYLGDAALDRWGGHNRKMSTAAPGGPAGPAGGAALAIFLGIVLDGIPESLVLGLSQLTTGGVSLAVLVAVFVSNLPESLAATVGLKARGWRGGQLIALWTVTALVSGLAAAAGFRFFDADSSGVISFANGFAGGAVLTMLADTMAPEAYANGGRAVGLATTVGFLCAFLLHALT
jgi:ZIP family zinc transporter